MTGEDDLERQVRRALQARAQQVQPRGDGLARIRARTRRSRRRLLGQPRVVGAAASAVLLSGVAAVTLLDVGDRDPTSLTTSPVPPAVSPPTSAPAPSTSSQTMPFSARASALPRRTPSASPSPSPSPSAADVVTSWPYPSVSAGAADKNPPSYLADPVSAAQQFVTGYLGFPEVNRVLGTANAAGGIVEVTLGREFGGGSDPVPVTTVRLIGAGEAHTAPYLVTEAVAPNLTLTAPADGGAVRSPALVRGTVRGVEEQILVELWAVGSPSPLGSARTSGGGVPRPRDWQATVRYPGSPGAGLAVARTLAQVGGGVQELVVSPARLR